jgi:hypothetical protein
MGILANILANWKELVPMGWEWLVIAVIVACILGIWMFVDCIANEPKGGQRVKWAMVIILTHPIGGLVYLIVRRPRRKRLLGR